MRLLGLAAALTWAVTRGDPICRDALARSANEIQELRAQLESSRSQVAELKEQLEEALLVQLDGVYTVQSALRHKLDEDASAAAARAAASAAACMATRISPMSGPAPNRATSVSLSTLSSDISISARRSRMCRSQLRMCAHAAASCPTIL